MDKILVEQGKWKEIEPMIFQRACIGQEHSASYNQNIADGHTELSIAIPFSINMNMESVQIACKKAWFKSRLQHPEVAIELSTDLRIPQMMTYKYLPDSNHSEVKEWMEETFRIIMDGRDYQDVLEMTYNKRLDTRGKRAIMWLVLDNTPDLKDSQRGHCLIFNVSHATVDFHSMMNFLDHYLEGVARGSDNDDAFFEEQQYDAAEIINCLPVNPINVYDRQYAPTQEQIDKAMIQAKEQLQLQKDKIHQSVALYPEPTYQFREHGTDCLIEKWSKKRSDLLFDALKSFGVGITYAGAAALVLAAYEIYGKGHETGALLGMTRIASRWITTIAVDDESRRNIVNTASDVIFLWIPFTRDMTVTQFNRRELLLHLGKQIKEEVSKHLQSPHYLSTVPFMSNTMVDGLLANKEMDDAVEAHGIRLGEESLNIIGPSAPGFSPQGIVKLRSQFKHINTVLHRHDMIYAGRQISHSPWIGMYTLDGRLRFTLGYDCKYYKREMMIKLLHLFQENLASAVEASSTSPLSFTSQL